MLVYVDDLLMVSTDTNLLQAMHNIFAAAFIIHRIEPEEMYLRMLLRHNKGEQTLELRQSRYVKNLMGHFPAFTEGGHPKTPLSTAKWDEEDHNVHGTSSGLE